MAMAMALPSTSTSTSRSSNRRQRGQRHIDERPHEAGGLDLELP